MKNRALILVVLGLLGIALYVGNRRSGQKANSKKGEPAPNFSLTDLDDHKVVLTEYHGKVVLLNFWATWCEPCRKEIPRFIQFQNTYGPQGLQVLGISMDDDSKPVREFRAEYQVNYPIAMGDAKLAESYGGVLGLPISFVIDPQGRITAKHIGAVDLTKIEGEIQRLLPKSSEPATSKSGD